ncbi:hypothetical protein MG293_002784 [Ovis ammon polii]|uniref:Uncharacterized protein n=1 Tax=Ovis ammon polii TaxID=230172 RepID=A0AAD4UM08_OVIAM|nr:hypothetical protein MG293_002784 [Ovis ammon polii]KAI4576472.1 hypothetical protein MJT46_002307 [Ovis ammon polii x Ovis aries]
MLFVKLRQAPFEITRAFLSFASVQSGDEWNRGKKGGTFVYGAERSDVYKQKQEGYGTLDICFQPNRLAHPSCPGQLKIRVEERWIGALDSFPLRTVTTVAGGNGSCVYGKLRNVYGTQVDIENVGLTANDTGTPVLNATYCQCPCRCVCDCGGSFFLGLVQEHQTAQRGEDCSLE